MMICAVCGRLSNQEAVNEVIEALKSGKDYCCWLCSQSCFDVYKTQTDNLMEKKINIINAVKKNILN